MSTKNTRPDIPRVTPCKVVVHPERNADEVSIHCPYCGKVHHHGWVHGEVEAGHRAAHCGHSGGYHITAPTSWKEN